VLFGALSPLVIRSLCWASLAHKCLNVDFPTGYFSDRWLFFLQRTERRGEKRALTQWSCYFLCIAPLGFPLQSCIYLLQACPFEIRESGASDVRGSPPKIRPKDLLNHPQLPIPRAYSLWLSSGCRGSIDFDRRLIAAVLVLTSSEIFPVLVEHLRRRHVVSPAVSSNSHSPPLDCAARGHQPWTALSTLSVSSWS
jgi:hypothetical protein